MDDRLKFILDLVDKISGPAAKIAKSMRGVADAMKAVDKAESKVGGGGRMATTLRRLGDTKVGRAVRALGTELRGLGPAASKAWGGVSELAGGIGAMAGGALVAGGLVVAAAGYGASVVAFKEGALSAMATFLGSQDQAKQLYQKTIDLASYLRIPAKDALEGVNDLLAAGFKADEAMQIFKGALDLKSLKGADTKALTTILGQIKAKGKLQTEELLQLAESGGLGIDKVYAELGRLKGIDAGTTAGMQKLQKLLEGGAIDSATAIKAVQGAIKSMTGNELGGYAEKSRNSLSALWQGLKDAPTQWILRADTSAAIEPLRRFMQALNDAFDPSTASGQKFVSAISAMASALAAFADGAGSGFMAAFKPVLDVFRDASAGGMDWAKIMRDLGKVVGFIAAAIVIGFGAIAAAVSFVIDNWQVFAAILLLPLAPILLVGAAIWALIEGVLAFVAVFTDAVAHGVSLGSALVDGIAAGIRAAWGALKGLWNGLVGTLPEAAANKLKIASPSRVMKQIGVYAVMGFTEGIQSQAANTNAAMSMAVAPPAPSMGMAPIASAGSAASGGSKGQTIINIVPQVTAMPGVTHDDARQQGEAFARGVRAALADELSKLAGESA